MTLWNVCLVYTHTYINGISVFPAHSVLEQMSNPSSLDRPVISTCSFMLAGRDTCYLTSVWEVGDVIRASAAGLKHTCQLHHLEITTLSQPPWEEFAAQLRVRVEHVAAGENRSCC